MNILSIIFQFFGSITLIIYGMKMLSEGLQRYAGSKMERILHLMAGNRILALLTGVIVTVLVQSSSATTVMVVSFANAGMITLQQSIPVIMGANIGTTVSSWIISIFGFNLNITLIAFFLLFVSFPFLFFKKNSYKTLFEVLVGLSLLFIGLYFIQKTVPSSTTQNSSSAFSFFSNLKDNSVLNILLCALVGVVVTSIVSSSAACMALALTLAYNGWIGVYSACAICLGMNIGTTSTALISAIGTSDNAKRAALAHMLFNVIGTIIVLMFFFPFISFVNYLVPYDIFALKGDEYYHSLPIFLSMFHTVFNISVTVLFLPFVKQFSYLIERIIPVKETKPLRGHYVSAISSSAIQLNKPELYLGLVRDEIYKLGQLCQEMAGDYKQVLEHPNEDMTDTVKKIKADENYADEMEEELISLCVKLMSQSPTPKVVTRLSAFTRIIDELESITDSCYSLSSDAVKRYKEGYKFSETAQNKMISYTDLVLRFLNFVISNISKINAKIDMAKCYEYETEINSERQRMILYIEDRMKEDPNNIQKELILFDMVRSLEHIGDFCTNICQTLHKL